MIHINSDGNTGIRALEERGTYERYNYKKEKITRIVIFHIFFPPLLFHLQTFTLFTSLDRRIAKIRETS